MAYSDFSLKTVKEKLDVEVVEVESFNKVIKVASPSEFLLETLNRNLALALAVNTEKARSEWLISPILLEIKKIRNQISLFSGSEFVVDSTLGLNGVCDFLISLSKEQLIIEAPALLIVEAKRLDLNSGIGQCIAEMVAANIFNSRNEKIIPVIYGAVTSGDRWKFLRLENKIVTVELMEHNITPVDQVLNILLSFIG